MNGLPFGPRRCYDPMTALAIGSTVLSAGGSIYGGMQASQSAKEEAALQRQQGDLAAAEASRNATDEAYNQTQNVTRQKMAFLANGVTLEGSPLEVLAETKNQGQRSVNAILQQGAAQKNLSYQSAQVTQNKGRAALISGVLQAGSTTASGISNANKAGVFDTPKKTTAGAK